MEVPCSDNQRMKICIVNRIAPMQSGNASFFFETRARKEESNTIRHFSGLGDYKTSRILVEGHKQGNTDTVQS